MQWTRRSMLRAGAAAALAAALPMSVRARSRPVRILVGFPPGSTPDVLARKVAEYLGKGYADAVLVENRSGAGGQLAVMETARSDAAAFTVLLTPMSILGVYPHTYRSLPYDSLADLKPVCKGVTYDYGIGVGPAVPDSVRSVPELMQWYKANPGRANMGSPATGSTLHFVAVMLGRAAGVPMTHIGYRGSSAAIQDMLGGTLPALCTPLGSFLNQPRLRVLATSGRTRSQFLPDVGTLSEQGYPDMVFDEWYGFFVGAGTPDAEVDRLNQVLRQALADPSIVQTLAEFGMQATPSSPEELAASLRHDLDLWRPIVESIGFTADA